MCLLLRLLLTSFRCFHGELSSWVCRQPTVLMLSTVSCIIPASHTHTHTILFFSTFKGKSYSFIAHCYCEDRGKNKCEFRSEWLHKNLNWVPHTTNILFLRSWVVLSFSAASFFLQLSFFKKRQDFFWKAIKTKSCDLLICWQKVNKIVLSKCIVCSLSLCYIRFPFNRILFFFTFLLYKVFVFLFVWLK